jgi:hypothetical protein
MFPTKSLLSTFSMKKPLHLFVVIICIATLSGFAACGTPAAATPAPLAKPTSTPTQTPAPTPTPTPRPTSTPKPTPTPVPIVQPTQPPSVATVPPPPPASPAILDLRPASMSIVGHLDCQRNGTFVCLARVLAPASNSRNLNWSSFANVPGNIVFIPARGVLAPGQSVLVTIDVPFTACTPGLFFFQGPVNTHTITWAC